MASTKVEIIIKGKDEASAALNSVQGSLQDLTQHAGDAALTFGVLGAAGTALIASITMTAARTEELGIVLDAMGRAAGISQGELAAIEQSITGLGITTQSARTIMAQFMGAELDLAIATDIARAAQDLAVIGMKDSSQAASDLTYALISMNPRLLRQYGLYVNLNDVYDAAAEMLGKEAVELTEVEKRAAFLNATLAAAEGYAGVYEAAMESAGKQTRSLRRYVEELANTFGAPFLPVLGNITDMLTKFAKAMLALPAPVVEAMSGILAMGTAALAAQGSVAGLVLLLPRLVGALQFLLSPLGLITGVVSAVAAAWIMDFGGIQEKTETVFQAIRGLIETTLTAVRGTVETTLTAIKTWWDDNHELIRSTAETVWDTIQATIQATITTVQTIIETVTAAISQIWTEYSEEITATAIATWEAIQTFIDTTLGTISSVIETTLTTIKTWWNVDHALLKATAETIWAAIQLFIDTTLAGIWGTIEVIVRTITDWWDTNHEAIRATAETVWEAIRSLIEIATDAVKRIIETTLGTIIAWWDENHELIRATAETIWAAIQSFIETTLGFILNDVVMPILNSIKKFWDEHGETILGIVETIWGAIETFIDTTINAILGIITTVMLLISGDWDAAWEEIKGVADTIWEGIESIVDDAINVVKDTLDIVLSIIKDIWDTAWDAIKAKLDDIWEAIKAAAANKMWELKNVVAGWLDSIVTHIRAMAGAFLSAGIAIIEGLIDGARQKAQDMINAVIGVVQDALNAAKALLGIACPDPSPVWAELGVGMGEGLIVGFQSMLGDMQSTVTQGIGGLSGAMNFSMAGAAAGGSAARSFASGGRGGITINIGNLYGTDREAARRFGRQIADDLRRQGVLA